MFDRVLHNSLVPSTIVSQIFIKNLTQKILENKFHIRLQCIKNILTDFTSQKQSPGNVLLHYYPAKVRIFQKIICNGDLLSTYSYSMLIVGNFTRKGIYLKFFTVNFENFFTTFDCNTFYGHCQVQKHLNKHGRSQGPNKPTTYL